MRCRDELVEMMLRRTRRTEAAAKERLDDLHEQHREIEETLIGVFGQVLETAQNEEAAATPEDAPARDAAFGREVRELLAQRGGVAALAEQDDGKDSVHAFTQLLRHPGVTTAPAAATRMAAQRRARMPTRGQRERRCRTRRVRAVSCRKPCVAATPAR